MTVLLQQWSSLSLSAARQLADHLLLQAEQQGQSARGTTSTGRLE
jgi:hypothetical protein